MERGKNSAELRLLDRVEDGEQEENHEISEKDQEKPEEIEVAEEAESLDANRIEFGNVGFMSLGVDNQDDDEEAEEASEDCQPATGKKHPTEQAQTTEKPTEVAVEESAVNPTDDTINSL